jgi:c-di-GMP-related signal transduction protein
MDVFVARQPIFDRHQKVVAYELLFRKNQNNFYENTDADEATKNVISNGFLVIGMENLTGGKKAFINFTESLLKSDIITTLPKELVVVEILEDVDVTTEIIAACKKLKEMGYTLALDDFVFEPKYKPLIDLVDIIKIDFKLTLGDERKEVISRIGSKKIKYLAEKVETMEEYESAIKDGYSFFQGYFFSKPVILKGKDMPTYKNNHVMLLSELAKHEVDFDKIENIIKKDVSLSYKLLKFINSASFGFKRKIDSIIHALTLLGKEDVAKWVYLIALRDMGENKPDELMRTSVIRAKFGELMAPKIGMANRTSDIFFMGLLSLINTLTNLPMEAALSQIPISEEVKQALIGEDNKFRDILELITAYEIADWSKFATYSEKLNFDEKTAPELFVKSLEWSNEFMAL